MLTSRNAILPTLLAIVVTGSSCGEKEGPRISVGFSGAAAFADTAVTDVVFEVANVLVDGRGLDLNNDGQPDRFAFPETCSATFVAGCGVPAATAATVDLGKLPLNFRYDVTVRFRNSTGTTLYSGTTQFDNLSTVSSLSIVLAAAP